MVNVIGYKYLTLDVKGFLYLEVKDYLQTYREVKHMRY